MWDSFRIYCMLKPCMLKTTLMSWKSLRSQTMTSSKLLKSRSTWLRWKSSARSKKRSKSADEPKRPLKPVREPRQKSWLAKLRRNGLKQSKTGDREAMLSGST